MMSFKNSYRKIYEGHSKIKQQEDYEEIEFFSNLICHDHELDILDLGCAEGKLAVNLALKGHNVTGVDISKKNLESAAKHAKENKVKIDFVECDIELNSEYIVQKFDIIYFMDVIEHLRCPICALENIRKMLKEYGTLIIQTPNVVAIPYTIYYYVINRKKLIDYYSCDNLWDLHLQLYDYRTLERLLNLSGLRVYEAVPTKITTMSNKLNLMALNSLSVFLSKRFPFLSDNLLLKCKKETPINVEKQIIFWDEFNNK